MVHEAWLHRIAVAVDAADHAGDLRALYGAIRRCDALLDRVPEQIALELQYFKSNCWAAVGRLRTPQAAQWDWDRPEHIYQAFCLRSAVNSPRYRELSSVRRHQIKTNLANLMNNIGRPIYAINIWGQVVDEDPNFAAALGNRSIGLTWLAKHLPDVLDQLYLAQRARKDVISALSPTAFWDSGQELDVKPMLERQLKHIEEFIAAEQHRDTKSHSKSGANLYALWCKENCLYINPRNFIGSDKLELSDTLHLPPHTYKKLDTPLRYVNLFNQMKCDFAYARRNLYEGDVHELYDHTPDGIFDANDGSVYGPSIEKYKSALRDSYAIFDKIALFINNYYHIGAKTNKIKFRNIWYKKLSEQNDVLDLFVERRNWPLRGLFYLSKDLHDKDFVGIADPRGETLDRIRNQIEHRFLAVTEIGKSYENDDVLAYVSLEELRGFAFGMLRKSREAIILLCLAMHAEEYRRKLKSSDADGVSIRLEEPARPATRLTVP